MPKLPEALWLSVSPSFKVYDQPTLRYLSRQVSIGRWEYCQTQDEASSLEVVLILLHDYLKSSPQPVHLIGHGMSGLVGLLYARRYPGRVASLTLLSVGAKPAIDWQAYYYGHLRFLPCSRDVVLKQVVYSLLGYQSRTMLHSMVELLEQDLRFSPSPHTLLNCINIASGGAGVPLLVCGSQDDSVVSPRDLQAWQPWLTDRDRLWQCPDGRYFFHYLHPKLVGKQILSFWASFNPRSAQSVPVEALN